MSENRKILVIDSATSGIAGDMLLGALIDLGANTKRIITAIKTLENPAYGYNHIDIAINEVMRGPFRATQINVTSTSAEKRQGKELIEIVEKAAATITMSTKAREFASRVIRTLINTEAKLHKTSFDNTHLHEIALVDTSAEILGCATALDDLALFESQIYATPIAVGGGVIEFSHGIVPVPAPAVLAILQAKNFPLHGGPIEHELATPTGVSLLVNLATQPTRFYPALTPLKIGYGAGTKEYPQMPTVLRLTLGISSVQERTHNEIAVLETNLDDISGEVIGYTIERLIEEGAKDVSVIPTITKKNRPGYLIKIVAEKKDVTHLSNITIAETGTLGVRIYYCQRHIISREVRMMDLTILGNKETIKVKISKNAQGEIIRIKPEYEDLKRLAEKTKQPLRELLDLTVSQIQNFQKNQ
ncbi:nickel pincer cofactor biosynthesis protein LarC [Candidatus Bathycorpusculum sp.]|uniref:nickel pincer cofactor biosynthesis protein LarC n=1 Tax=Candidatus Bathycorpusculum sp. TaxID=2994959 RepID=UPI0028334688|nr:nickel pincer cofactor biosynthesis protein LarC [Candidatus Termitimicrobium sp.]MCL2430987.1 nickel pincer cofactor biosynthesis protein LarC [Candidatus Termitimicrobium sp.]